jgi:hypothetical protein
LAAEGVVVSEVSAAIALPEMDCSDFVPTKAIFAPYAWRNAS